MNLASKTALAGQRVRRASMAHFVGYFVITLEVCIAWPRPFVVAGALIVFAAVLETLQALTPDRWANPWAPFYSACGVLARL